MARLNPDDKERYRLTCRRVLGVPDDVENANLDAMIEYARTNDIPYPVSWVRERMHLEIP